MPHAFILFRNGQTGLATASRMREAGWSFTLPHRARRGVRFSPTLRMADVVHVNRAEPGALPRALGSGADILIDVIAYGPEHARQLLVPAWLKRRSFAPRRLRTRAILSPLSRALFLTRSCGSHRTA